MEFVLSRVQRRDLGTSLRCQSRTGKVRLCVVGLIHGLILNVQDRYPVHKFPATSAFWQFVGLSDQALNLCPDPPLPGVVHEYPPFRTLVSRVGTLSNTEFGQKSASSDWIYLRAGGDPAELF